MLTKMYFSSYNVCVEWYYGRIKNIMGYFIKLPMWNSAYLCKFYMGLFIIHSYSKSAVSQRLVMFANLCEGVAEIY